MCFKALWVRSQSYLSTNPVGSFFLELLKEPATTVPPSGLSSTLLPQVLQSHTGITAVEVKDLRQTIATKTCYGKMNILFTFKTSLIVMHA
jgi:hypothetical protein